MSIDETNISYQDEYPSWWEPDGGNDAIIHPDGRIEDRIIFVPRQGRAGEQYVSAIHESLILGLRSLVEAGIIPPGHYSSRRLLAMIDWLMANKRDLYNEIVPYGIIRDKIGTTGLVASGILFLLIFHKPIRRMFKRLFR